MSDWVKAKVPFYSRNRILEGLAAGNTFTLEDHPVQLPSHDRDLQITAHICYTGNWDDVTMKVTNDDRRMIIRSWKDPNPRAMNCTK